MSQPQVHTSTSPHLWSRYVHTSPARRRISLLGSDGTSLAVSPRCIALRGERTGRHNRRDPCRASPHKWHTPRLRMGRISSTSIAYLDAGVQACVTGSSRHDHPSLLRGVFQNMGLISCRGVIRRHRHTDNLVGAILLGVVISEQARSTVTR
jgi:hypothetical protein